MRLQFPPLQDYINGSFCAPALTLPAMLHDPNTGEAYANQVATAPDALELALQSAYQAHQSGMWRNTPPLERADWLERVAEHLQGKTEAIAQTESASTGIVIELSRMLVAIVHLAFRTAAQQLREGRLVQSLPGKFGNVEILRKPLGVAVCIVPWNAPAPLAAHKIANALAVGCPTLLKPSEWAPYSCQFLAQAIHAVGLPAGVYQQVHGGAAVGATLVGDSRVRAVSFTGGLQGGRAVATACAHEFKPMQLELGGNNALVVLESANLEWAAQGVVRGLTTLNGQWCRALGRLLVHEKVYPELLERALDALSQVRVGHSLDSTSQMGPLIHAAHRNGVARSAEHLQGLGGRILQSTPLPSGDGYWFAPTLVSDVSPDATLHETFGPLAVIHTFHTDEEALRLANQPPFGLGGYVFGEENHALRIARQMDTGGVKVNGVQLIGLHPLAPRPAWHLSGYGVEGTIETFDFFTGQTVVGIAHRE
ncbi:MAG TPA: aldehyde dehydrogenase family protein [Anaerolineales bacterium]|nr:aldehyde dehydrogenase family protein [Anaerolineales bacterium]